LQGASLSETVVGIKTSLGESMKKIWQAIIKFFTTTTPSPGPVPPAKIITDVSGITRTPQYGDKDSAAVKLIQARLNELGFFKGDIGGNFGGKTKDAIVNFQYHHGLTADGSPGPVTRKKMMEVNNPPAVKPPTTPTPARDPKGPAHYQAAKKYAGRVETDKAFQKEITPFWDKLGLKGVRTIVGSSVAWCGLFIFFVLWQAGFNGTTAGALAKNWGKWGQEIQWQTQGIPRGAIVHLNHKFDCKASSSNHVGLADGDCAANDIVQMEKVNGKWVMKKGATVPIFGGNQNNQVKRTVYDAREICEVRYPIELPLPPKITKSIDCNSGAAEKESTR
jgi:hypothetical protein